MVPEREPTCLGRVRHVLGSQVTVALDPDLAGVAPIFRGRLQAVGQIGSIVRIPQGLVDLLGQVSLLGISELAGAQVPGDAIQTGERWLQIQLLGEVDRTTGRFQRGVGNYPGLDDAVHFSTPEDLRAVFPLRVKTACDSDGSRQPRRSPFVLTLLDSSCGTRRSSAPPEPGRRPPSPPCCSASHAADGRPRTSSSSTPTASTTAPSLAIQRLARC